MIKEAKIREIERLFTEFMPLYHQKLSLVFRDDDGCLRLNKNQKRAILLISSRQGITSAELGRFLDLRKSSLTSLINSLAAMKLVEKRAVDTDRRKMLIYLTGAGQEYLHQMMERYGRMFQELFSALSEEEIDDCLAGMQAVTAALKKI